MGLKHMNTAEEILMEMIKLFQEYLEDIQETGKDKEGFLYGEKTAYVECLEIIQRWQKAKAYGLNYKIEERFPLNEQEVY